MRLWAGRLIDDENFATIFGSYFSDVVHPCVSYSHLLIGSVYLAFILLHLFVEATSNWYFQRILQSEAS